MNNKKIIVVGATGRVGQEMLSILLENNISVNNIGCAASVKSTGKILQYGNDKLIVQSVEQVDFSKYNIGLFSAGSEVSKKYARKAADLGCIVIDNTSYFRMFEDIPLVVPEINFNSCKSHNNIISNPNCSTIQMVMALKPLSDAFGGIIEIVASTYQSVSGAGQKGINELLKQTEEVVSKKDIKIDFFQKQIAFNLIPQIDSFTDSLYTKEELKMMNETRKILGNYEIAITATCVRVPVFVSHAVSTYVKFKNTVEINTALEALNNFDGITTLYDTSYPTPIECSGQNKVYIGRIRKHQIFDNALSFWCVSDNLRKGAALNAIQIAKKLSENKHSL